MASRKGLFRLAILILLIPVGLLLVLHFFGENSMEVEMKKSLISCGLNSSTNVMLGGQEFSVAQLNQIARVEKVMRKKKLELVDAPNDCFTDSVGVYLVDRKNNLRGTYSLEQGDINRLFVELDIILMQDNYGQPVSR